MGNSSSKTNETRNILPEVSGEYEKQLGLPKVLLQEIGSRVELSSIKNFSLSCKQVYFALKEDSFWRMFALEWFPELEEVEGDNWKEKVENSFAKWQKNWCNKKFTFERVRGAEVATLKGSSGLSSVFSEFSFVVGEESVLFVFEIKYSYAALCGMGICIQTESSDNWLHGGQNACGTTYFMSFFQTEIFF